MTRSDNPWLRVSRDRPCPICGKTDWCLVAADGTAAICPRTESPNRAGDAGFLHRLTDPPARMVRVRRVAARVPPPDLTALAAACHRVATPDRLSVLATTLGLRPESLAAFQVGWDAGRSAWTFPMTDPVTGRVTNLRLRTPGGRKFGVAGGKDALFLPTTPPGLDDVLLVAEGPTDAAAAHGLGFLGAVGRPSCTGGTRHLVNLARLRRPPAVVLVADGDEPGRRGADALAAALLPYARAVTVIAPQAGFKDLRDWVAGGATRADLEGVIRSAPALRPTIKFTTRGSR